MLKQSYGRGEGANTALGSQHPEHERRACGSDVQELPIERALPPRRWLQSSIC